MDSFVLARNEKQCLAQYRAKVAHYRPLRYLDLRGVPA